LTRILRIYGLDYEDEDEDEDDWEGPTPEDGGRRGRPVAQYKLKTQMCVYAGQTRFTDPF
jgi:hypothetical protein